jgi:hypothetical protein
MKMTRDAACDFDRHVLGTVTRMDWHDLYLAIPVFGVLALLMLYELNLTE